MRYLFFLCVALMSCTLGVPQTWAASVKVESDFRNFHVGDIFSLDVIVDTEGKALNAVDLTITFPAEFLAFKEYDDGASVLNLWIDKPSFNNLNQIHLAGITPGGFNGNNLPIITLFFEVIKTGQGKVDITDAKFLLHDGEGTEARVTVQNLHLASIAGESNIRVHTIDDELPESFTPTILFDADVFAGQAVLIFSTEDKGSGLDHFKVKEGIFGRYVTNDSPYLIKNQALDRKIYIKAVDKNGNERTEILYPQTAQSWYKHVLILSILITCVLILIISFRLFRQVRQK